MFSQGKSLSVEFPWVLLVLRERIELSTSPLPKEWIAVYQCFPCFQSITMFLTMKGFYFTLSFCGFLALAEVCFPELPQRFPEAEEPANGEDHEASC